MLDNICSFNISNNRSNMRHIYFGTSIIDFAKVIETGISKKCNLKCPYCPNSLATGATAEQTMPISLFKKILLDLKKIDFDGRFAFHRYNEPTMVKVEDYIRMVKEYLPKVQTELSTNGTLLDPERLKELESAGIDKIIVTQHTPKGFIDKLNEIPDDLLKKVDVQYTEEFAKTNRAGAIISLNTSLDNTPCYMVKNAFIIDTDGQVPICADDFFREKVIGDVNINSIEEIWNNPHSKELREELLTGNRKFLSLCKKCDRTESHRQSSRHIEYNNALYRKWLLQNEGSAHLPSDPELNKALYQKWLSQTKGLY